MPQERQFKEVSGQDLGAFAHSGKSQHVMPHLLLKLEKDGTPLGAVLKVLSGGFWYSLQDLAPKAPGRHGFTLEDIGRYYEQGVGIAILELGFDQVPDWLRFSAGKEGPEGSIEIIHFTAT